MNISFEEADAFLIAHDAEAPCEACGADNWKISVDEDDMVSQLLMDIPNTTNQLGFIPVACGSCNNTRFFNSIAVMDWAKSRKETDGN